jgi:hypothetical protein
MERWLKIPEACIMLERKGYSITPRTLRDYTKPRPVPLIRSSKPSKFILFKEEWLDEFLEGKYHPEEEKLDS